MHEKTLEVKTNELDRTKEELQIQVAKSKNLKLSKRVQELEKERNQVLGHKPPLKPDLDLNSEVYQEQTGGMDGEGDFIKLVDQYTTQKFAEECTELLKHRFKNVNKRKLLEGNEEHSKQQKGLFECKTCSKIFSSKQGVTRHKARVHENQNEFKCKSCDYVSSDKSNFERHVRSVHDKQKPLNVHKCEYCDYDSINKSDIEKHIKSVHEKQKPSNVFKCKYCDFDSVHKSNIERHVKSIHKQQKPLHVIKCEFCDHTCRDKSNLARHVKSKHE